MKPQKIENSSKVSALPSLCLLPLENLKCREILYNLWAKTYGVEMNEGQMNIEINKILFQNTYHKSISSRCIGIFVRVHSFGKAVAIKKMYIGQEENMNLCISKKSITKGERQVLIPLSILQYAVLAFVVICIAL